MAPGSSGRSSGHVAPHHRAAAAIAGGTGDTGCTAAESRRGGLGGADVPDQGRACRALGTLEQYRRVGAAEAKVAREGRQWCCHQACRSAFRVLEITSRWLYYPNAHKHER